ncbi:MAG TPA: L,D-transpeptidase family protein [Solirubrobacteraceae bacterium]|jgi:lipoprotein-anchoring transpeptidase ErfK/SrfK|nr:L,D-transpeptidase family protein [Solirubrobacteraceae bacterium]
MDTTIIPSFASRLRSLAYRWVGPRLLIGLAAPLVLGVTAGSAAGAGIRARVQATQQLAVLLTAHSAHQRPAARSPQIALVAARRPITGEQSTLPVIGHATAPDGVRWLKVMLPGRPDGSTGWIAAQSTRRLLTGWHIVVDLAGRRVSVYHDGRLVRTFQAVVGKPSTPTPIGRFFVEETLQMAAGQPGGPFALALSARSNALQEFEGGPGQIALHGRNNLGGTLGSAASHGCVRLATANIDWLAARIGPGTPTTIYADRHA